jgi:hypothetical protein
VTPVDTWHFTTWLDLFDHWQTVIAGSIALVAAIITVLITLRVERRKADRELDALRKSLGVELRLQINRAFGVYFDLLALGSQPEPITARMVGSLSQMPAPIIFSANAGKIGLLEGDAMDVTAVYMLLEGARGFTAQLMTFRTPDHLAPAGVLSTANTFLAVCERARGVLPRLRTGDASHDAKDEALVQQINAALAARRT